MESLKSIFFSEFDNIVGPKITFQVPESFVGSELFETIHEYVITKPNMCGHLITLTVLQHKIMGYPIHLEGSKYPRNGLLWNLCFVFDANENHQTLIAYQPIVQKLALRLKALEQESEFLFNNISKSRLQHIIEEIYYGLRTSGRCIIPVDEANTIYLKLQSDFGTIPSIKEHLVPILITNLEGIINCEWDLALQQIAPYINGIYHIKHISQISGVEIEIVKQCIQHLLYYNCVSLLDIFQYSNVYVCKRSFTEFATNSRKIKACANYVRLSNEIPSISQHRIVFLFSMLKYDVTLKKWVEENNVTSLNVDTRKFITFGLLNGIISRVHKYPLKLVKNKKEPMPQTKYSYFQQMLNGQTSYDEICCTLSQTKDQIDLLLQQDKNIVILSKD